MGSGDGSEKMFRFDFGGYETEKLRKEVTWIALSSRTKKGRHIQDSLFLPSLTLASHQPL
jgi:hypothetical protein